MTIHRLLFAALRLIASALASFTAPPPSATLSPVKNTRADLNSPAAPTTNRRTSEFNLSSESPPSSRPPRSTSNSPTQRAPAAAVTAVTSSHDASGAPRAIAGAPCKHPPDAPMKTESHKTADRIEWHQRRQAGERGTRGSSQLGEEGSRKPRGFLSFMQARLESATSPPPQARASASP